MTLHTFKAERSEAGPVGIFCIKELPLNLLFLGGLSATVKEAGVHNKETKIFIAKIG
jgi:hypothetical protein